MPVAIKISRQHGIDRGELGLDGQGLEVERAVSVVQGHGAGKQMRFPDLRLSQFRRWEDVLNPAGAEIGIGAIQGAQLRNRSEQFVPTGQRVAHAVLIERQNLLQRAVVREIMDVQPGGFLG